MSSRLRGGPAFPTPEFYEEKQIGVVDGMSLRDYFAGQALPAALAQEATGDEGRPCMYDVDAVARVAYQLADAMLKERTR